MFSPKIFVHFLIIVLTITDRQRLIYGLEETTDALVITTVRNDEIAVTTIATNSEKDEVTKKEITTSTTETISTKDEKTEENKVEEEEDATDDEPDPWADIEDDEGVVPKGGSSANFDIVDTMRSIRENNLDVPFNQTTANLNETFDKVIKAWEVIETYYLPQRQTWEKLLGLVTGLDVDVSPECFSSYFQGVSAFRNYAAWAYRCEQCF